MFVFVFFISLFVFMDKFKKNFKVFSILFILILLSMAIFSMKFLANNLPMSIKNTESFIRKSGGILGTRLAFYLESLIGSAGIIIFYLFFWISLI